MSTPTEQDSSLRDAESILQRLAATALDDDYYAQRESPPSRRSKVLTGVVAGLFGLLLTVAAVQTRNDRPATELEREALVDNIQVRQDLAATKQETVARLQDELADLRTYGRESYEQQREQQRELGLYQDHGSVQELERLHQHERSYDEDREYQRQQQRERSYGYER